MYASKGLVVPVVGLQYGSEGKGKIVAWLTQRLNFKAAVRSGGPQAAHTFYRAGRKFVNRQVPCSVVDPECQLLLGPCSIVDLERLALEIDCFELDSKRFQVDARAAVVAPKHMDLEKTGGLCSNIGSTGSGTGAVTVDKVLRQEGVLLKHQDEWLDKFGKYVGNTVEIVNWHLNRNHAILLEGTQGFGLCLNLSPYYPYVTSRDICASNLMAEAGIAPGFHAFTVGVLRTYPIRVAGNSGPTGSQSLTWDEITNRSGAGQAIIEHTSYTNKVRRVFEPDWDILKRAVQVNRPSFLAMTFADYLSHRDYGKREFEDLSPVSGEFVEQVESELGVPVGLIGTGPGEEDIIERRHVTSRYFELLPNA